MSLIINRGDLNTAPADVDERHRARGLPEGLVFFEAEPRPVQGIARTEWKGKTTWDWCPLDVSRWTE